MVTTWTSARWLFPVLAGAALLLLALAEPGPAMATPDYARATGQSCGTCHVGQPSAAGPFTAIGQQFAALPLHRSDPAAAWAQIQATGATGAPAPVQVPSQLPRTGDDPRLPVAPVALLAGLSLILLGAVLVVTRRARA